MGLNNVPAANPECGLSKVKFDPVVLRGLIEHPVGRSAVFGAGLIGPTIAGKCAVTVVKLPEKKRAILFMGSDSAKDVPRMAGNHSIGASDLHRLIECHCAGRSASDLTSRVGDRAADQLSQDSLGCSPILYLAGFAAPELAYCIGGSDARSYHRRI
jgi:hypothetical protein